MITISRRLAMQLRKTFRLALDLTGRGEGPPIRLEAGREGLLVTGRTAEAAVEFRLAGKRPAARAWIPLGLLAQVEGCSPALVQIQTEGPNLVASWRDGNVPLMVQRPAIEPEEESQLPDFPPRAGENGPEFLQALRHAAETTASEPGRFATDCIQLGGPSGQIASTDGRQLLIQWGFTLPWTENVLTPRSRIFASRELPRDVPVQIARVDQWLALRIGPWTFFRPIRLEADFPDVAGCVPREADACARVELSPSDAAFVEEVLNQRTTRLDPHRPITLDLSGRAMVRAEAAGKTRPHQWVLSTSRVWGTPMRICTHGHFLQRAIRLGFRRLSFVSPKAPALAQDGRREYVWALLDPESALGPARGAVPVASPATAAPRRD